jgi:hypothetical protein
MMKIRNYRLVLVCLRLIAACINLIAAVVNVAFDYLQHVAEVGQSLSREGPVGLPAL